MSIDQFFTRSPLSFHRVAQPRRERGAGGVGGGIDFFSFSFFFSEEVSCVQSQLTEGGWGWPGMVAELLRPQHAQLNPDPPPNPPSQHSDMQHCWLACLFP